MNAVDPSFKALIEKIKHDYDVRRHVLQRMKPHRIHEIGKEMGLPEDLNTSEMINHILRLEFRCR